MAAEALLMMALLYIGSLLWNDGAFKIVDCVVVAIFTTLVSSLFWKFPKHGNEEK